MSHFFAIEALPWLLPHLQRHPHWSPSSRWQEVMGSCRWAKTLFLARRLISFRCVIDPHHLLPSHSPLYLSPGARVPLQRAYTKSFISQTHISYALAMQAKTNEKSNTFTVKLPLPKQITRGPLRMDAQVLGSFMVYIYLSDRLSVYQRLFMQSFWFWSSLFLK